MADKLPPAPADLFSQLVTVIDGVRQIVSDLGLRPYRAFRVRERYAGPGISGGVAEREWAEILPPPDVRMVPLSRIAAAAGAIVEGSVELRRITRTLTREDLLGRQIHDDDAPDDERFSIALLQTGGQLAEFYNPASEPALGPLGWSMVVVPVNRREPLPSPA